nr:unnamed protein product [Callosobruchus analis]
MSIEIPRRNASEADGTQATLSTNIANIESRFSSSTVNAVVPNQASPSSGRIAQAETLELLRRSHNILLNGIVEGNNDENIVTDIINHVEPTANAHRVSITRLVLAKSILLKKQTILSHPSLNTVRILDDKTPLQVQQLRDLRDELKRRQDAGESNITINLYSTHPRHNAALRVLYYHLRHSYGIDETPVLPYAPGDIESVVENERCRIYWNYSFPTLELVQANKPDIVLLDHQQKTMFVIEFSAPAEVNIVSKEGEKRTKYQELLGQLRRLWPDYTVSLLVMVIGSLGGMRNTLLSALRAIPVCRAAAHILAARMQKAVILGWTTELRDDQLSCYESSSPRRRGYMSRMYERWCEMHPEHSTLTSQNLRDYVSYLRRQGYVRAPAQPAPSATGRPVDQAERSPIRPVEKEIDEVVSPGDFSDRRALHNIKRSFKLADLKREDEALGKRLSEVSDIWRINCEIYATALRLTRQERVRDSPVERAQRRVRQMEAKIQLARQEASRIQCVMEYRAAGKSLTRRVRRIAYGLRRDHYTLSQSVLVVVKQHCLDRIRMLMAAKRSLVAQARGLEENRMFSERPSRLFQQRPPVIEQPPTVDRVEAFWRDVYEQPKPLQADTPALAQFESVCRRTSNTNVLRHPINTEEIVGALRGAKNFAAPGPDGINTYWLKQFPSCHRHLARVFNSWLNQEQPIPAWFVEGRTVLLPKTGDLSDPKNYRSITCLNACYKLFTRILYTRILEAVNPVFLDVYEQRGSKKGVAGCKENLLIDRCVTQDSAFDTTSHELIVRLFECLSVDNQIVGCIKHLMPLWKTRFTITSGETRVRTELVSFKRGVFQGDSLSPLLFCISLLPLSIALKNTKGYSCSTPNHRRHKVTHLFHMDDLKLYASGQRDLQHALRVVQEYSHAIGMEFGTDKCAMVHLKKGRCGDSEEEEQLVDGSILRQLHAGDTYTYLGVAQRHVQEANTVKECLRRKYLHRLRQIWSSELSGKNKVAATNMLDVPLLLYTFGVLHWTVDELRQIDTKTRKRMNMETSLHPKSSVPRIYLPRHLGGRGLLSLERLHNRVVLATACNVTRSNDPLIRFVREHENAGKGAFLFKAAKRAAEELSLTLDFTRRCQQSITELAPAQLKPHIKAVEVEFLLKLHKDKPMHGIFYKHLEEHGLSEQLTFSFLRSSGLKSETEGCIMACQDGVVNTLVYRGRVMGMNVPDTRCRSCRQAPETLMQLLSACKTYAGTAYVHRHNAALRTPVLPYAPGDIESVVENERCRIYWNYSFPTLELIQANKPDIVLLDHQQKTMFVIEFSAPAEVNIVSKEEEKRTKYQELLGQLRRLWPVYTVSLLVMVIGSLGGMRNTLLSALRAIPVCRAAAHILAARMQKAVILGWTTELKDDLLSCYESSSPRRRGYMSRTYQRWCNLRDYVSYLRRQGYVRAPTQPAPSANGMPVDQAKTSPIKPVEREIDEVVSPGDFSDRRALHNIKRSFKLADLKREDEALGKRLSEVSDIWRINCEIYAAALRLTRQERVRDSPVERAQRRVCQMEAKIQLARMEASRIQCVMEYRAAGKPFTRRVRRIAYGLRRDHHTLSQSVLVVVKQHCLDRIQMLMAAKRSLVARARGLEENNMFSERPSRLFQQRPPAIEQPPTADRVEAFWRDVYEQPKPLQADTPALAQFESVCSRTPNTNVLRHPIDTEEIVGALRGAKNFAAPGPDGINTYWLKQFPSCHRHLAREQPIPAWFVEGRTVLLPKTGDLSDPKNYRPITCLNACYKLFTRILYMRILEAVNPVFLSVYEQRGSKKGVAGCKENLLIDRCVTQDSVQYKRNLSMAWIDYRKAFDTTSHELIVRLLECLSVDNQIVGCIKQLMPLWKTRFSITSGETRVWTELVTFKRGVFQGDSLSPLLFCISLLPLSITLKNTKGYSCGTPNHRRHRVTHLFYMDDLKLYTSGQRDLQHALRVVQVYSHAIGMEFGTDKCAMVHLKKGRSGDSEEEEQLVDGSILRHLHAGDTYTYLGAAQRHVQEATTVKECLRRKYLHRLRQIWSSELSGKNKVAATNMLAVPLLLYTFGAIHWTSSVPRIYLPRHLGGRGLLSLERLHNRVVLATACNVIRSNDPLIRFVREHEIAVAQRHVQESNTVKECLRRKYLHRLRQIWSSELSGKNKVAATNMLAVPLLLYTFVLCPANIPSTHLGGRGLLSLERLHNRVVLATACNVTRSNDPLIRFVREHENAGKGAFLFKAAKRAAEELSLTLDFTRRCQQSITELTPAQLKPHIKAAEVEFLSKLHKDKPMHGIFYKHLEEHGLSEQLTFSFLRSSGLKSETEGFIMACQDGVVNTLSLPTGARDAYASLVACKTYAGTAYVHRHNAALRVLYYHLRHSYGIDETPVLPYAPGDIEYVVENERCRIYWNYSFPTLELVQANKPDIVLLDHQQKTMFVIEFSAPAEVNIVSKEEEKRTKYQELLGQLRSLWPDYTVSLLVMVIGSLGGMRNTLLSALRAIPVCRAAAHILAARMQKAVILGAHYDLEQPPTVDRVEAFWRDVYEQPKLLQADTPALAQFESVCRRTSNTNVLRHPINTEEIVGALRGAKNFAAPGPDGINTYWLKQFPSCHRHLARVFNSWLNQEQPIPAWFVEGRTRGSKKGVAGYKENLLIDRCVTQDSVQYKRNLSMAWIDYRKAFDTTSHELIVRLLECLSVDNQIVGCIKQLMPLWKTRFSITSGETRVRTELVTFKRGVFQGDSLSPLLFCISLLPLSITLKNTKGYSCGTPNHRRHRVTHLFYMDDLKLYASGQRDLQHALRVVQEYSHAIGMEFGTDKCAMVHLKKGRCGDSEEEEQLVDGSILRQLHAGDTYTYLGVAQRHVQEANTVKECLRRKYLHRLRQIWSSELSGKNKVAATNMLAVPLLLYTFGALHWTVDELRQIDTKTRKRMNMERSLHPKSSVPRIYLPRHLGGRGLLSLERLHNRVVLATACNVTRSNDPLIRFVREHENAGKGAFLFKAAKRAAEELSLTLDFTRRCQQSITELAPAQLKTHIKAAEVEFLLKLHKDKPMHGIFYKHLEEHGLSEQLTFSFLRSSGLKSETEGFIMACQDGVVNTLVYHGRVMGMNVPDTRCRACRQAPETLMHLLSACKTYAGTAYVHRHNAALRVLYYHLRHSYGIDETPVLPYAPGDIESVVENERCRIYWNYSFPTLELVQANKPDIVLLDHQQKTMFVIEFSVPAEVNIVSKEEEKRTKYQELLGQLRRLWPDYPVSLLVMVIRSLGGMRNTLLSALHAIPVCTVVAHILAARMQKAVILGSLRLLRAHDTRTQ